MKKLLLLPTLLMCVFCSAQEVLTYRNQNETYSFQVSHDEYYITFNTGNKESIERLSKKFTELSASTALIKTEKTRLNFNERKAGLANEFNDQLQRIEPVLIWEDGTRQICNSQLIVKTKNKGLLNETLKLWTFTTTPDQFVPDQYLVKIENISTEQLLIIVTQLAAHKDVEFAEPDFISFTKLYTNDTYYSSQWAINNAGYLGGTPDADMDVDDAWLLSTGQTIKVAIVDVGVDLTHPDLTSNLWSLGYDATGYNPDGRPDFNDAHGTACAGIVAAVANNNAGVAGVAYNSKIFR